MWEGRLKSEAEGEIAERSASAFDRYVVQIKVPLVCHPIPGVEKVGTTDGNVGIPFGFWAIFIHIDYCLYNQNQAGRIAFFQIIAIG